MSNLISASSTPDESPTMRPVVLLTPDFATDAADPAEAEYILRVNYCSAIKDAGGIPLIVPYGTDNIGAVLSICDGVLITGSQPGATVTPEREAFETALIEAATRERIPLMGICHGMQLLGRTLGGHLAKEIPGNDSPTPTHIPSRVPIVAAHKVSIMEESILAPLAPTLGEEVNSLHRHGLRGQGRFRVAALAQDGVIEAIEGDTPNLSLGIQWHPEYGLTPLDRKIFTMFIARCAERVGAAQNIAPRAFISARDRLSAQGLVLPDVSQVPPGAFVGAIRWGNQITVSGQVPLRRGEVMAAGRLGDTVSIGSGRECARQCLLNALAQLDRAAGGLDRIAGFVRLGGYVAAAPEFTEHGKVIDAASELLRELFPDRWQHARVALGMASLPRGVPVEIELTAVISEEVRTWPE